MYYIVFLMGMIVKVEGQICPESLATEEAFMNLLNTQTELLFRHQLIVKIERNSSPHEREVPLLIDC